MTHVFRLGPSSPCVVSSVGVTRWTIKPSNLQTMRPWDHETRMSVRSSYYCNRIKTDVFLVEQRLYYTWYKLEILFILINSNPVDQTPWIRKRITVGVTLWNLAVPTLRGLLILHLLLVLSRVYRRSPAGSRTRTVDHLVLHLL